MKPSLVLVALALPTLIGLIWARYQERRVAAGVLKVICSSLFVAVGCLELPGEGIGTWLLAGLFASCVGDGLLIWKGKAWIAAALAVFFGAHIAYAIGVGSLVWPLAFGDGALLAVLLLGFLVGAGFCVRSIWTSLGSLQAPGSAYGAAVALTASLCLLACALNPTRGRLLLGLAGVLFFVSDLAVAQQHFGDASKRHWRWGLPTYYSAQFCFAFSIGMVGAE